MARKTKYSVVDDELFDWIIKEEGFLDKPTDIGDGKVTIGSGLTDPKWIDKYKKKGYWSKEDNRKAVAEELQKRSEWAEDTLPNCGSLPANTKKAMLSYKYNYDFTKENSPKLFGAMESGNFVEAVRQMDATSKNPKFKKGLQARREREQQWGLQGLFEKPVLDRGYEYSDATTLVNPYTAKIQNITFTDQYIPTSPAYNLVEADKVSSEINEYDKVRRAIDAQVAYRRLIQDNAWENQEPKRYIPTSGINYVIDSYSEGGKLDRKKSWDELSMKEKADMIRVAVENGITTLPEIREKYNEFAMGGDTEETYEDRTLPEVEVIAPRKWFVGYDENTNPIYTTDYRQSQEYLQNQIPLSSIEQDRIQWTFRNKGANGQVRPGLHGDAADLAQAAQIGIGTALSPFAYKGITGLMANPIVDAAFTADGVINAPSKIKEGIEDISNGNYDSAAWNLGTTALDILGGANLARRVPEGRRFIQDVGDRYQGMKDAEYFLSRQKTPEHVFDVANRNWINNGGNEAGLYKTGIKDNKFGTRYPDYDNTVDKTYFSDMVENGGDMTLNVHLGGEMPTSDPTFVEIQPREQWIALNKYLKGVPSGTYFGEIGRTKNYAEQYLHTKPSRVKAFKDAVKGRKENNPLWQDEIDWYNTKLEEGDPLQIAQQKYLLDNNQPLTEDSYMFILKRAAKGDKGDFELRYDSTPMGLFQNQGQVYKDFHNTLLEMSPREQVKAINNWMHSVFPKARPAYLENGQVMIPRPLLRKK